MILLTKAFMTEADFLKACVDNPDDDLTRLAFADWLEERGDSERADFIRLRVELWSQELRDKRERNGAEELVKQHRERWAVALAVLAHPVWWWRLDRSLKLS